MYIINRDIIPVTVSTFVKNKSYALIVSSKIFISSQITDFGSAKIKDKSLKNFTIIKVIIIIAKSMLFIFKYQYDKNPIDTIINSNMYKYCMNNLFP